MLLVFLHTPRVDFNPLYQLADAPHNLSIGIIFLGTVAWLRASLLRRLLASFGQRLLAHLATVAVNDKMRQIPVIQLVHETRELIFTDAVRLAQLLQIFVVFQFFSQLLFLRFDQLQMCSCYSWLG